MSLYLKYRPQNFGSVVGQSHAKKTIQNALKAGKLSHAYLFSGPRGTGKTSLARILAKGLNCENLRDEAEPCNQCRICEAINQSRLVDLIEIDAASNRGIDEIRELREKIVFAPSQAKAKVYIIDEVHMLTKEAFNALLKTLEEPPAHAYFVLATTEAHKIPETIVSRCQQFSFSRISVEDITQRLEDIALQEGIKPEKEALELIAKLSNGGLRDAIGLLEQMMTSGEVSVTSVKSSLSLTGSDHLEKFFQYLMERKALKAIELLSQISAGGKNISQFTQEAISLFREKMLIGLGSSEDVKTVLRFIEIFTEARTQIDLSPIPQLPIEMAIIKACDYEVSIEEIPAETPKEKPVEKVQKKEKEPVEAVQATEELTLEKIKADWGKLLQLIDTPFIKMSLQDGEPKAFEGGILTISFKSATFMEKINAAPNQAVVQKAFEQTFGQRLALNLEARKVELSPLQKKQEDKEEAGPTPVEMASEVFGLK